MEALEQLERRLSALLTELDTLRAENASLARGQTEILDSLTQENATLRASLAQEQERNSITLSRIEKLLERVKEKTGERTGSE